MLLIAGIWLWVAGNRRIRNGGHYTMKYWGIGLVVFWGLALLVGLAAVVADPSLASTPEPKNKITAEMTVDLIENRHPDYIDDVCSYYDKFGGDDALRATFAKAYNEAMKGYPGRVSSAEEVLDELLSRCTQHVTSV